MELILGGVIVVIGVAFMAFVTMERRRVKMLNARKRQASKEKRSASAKAAAARKKIGAMTMEHQPGTPIEFPQGHSADVKTMTKLPVPPTTERADVNRQYVAPNPGTTTAEFDPDGRAQQNQNASLQHTRVGSV